LAKGACEPARKGSRRASAITPSATRPASSSPRGKRPLPVRLAAHVPRAAPLTPATAADPSRCATSSPFRQSTGLACSRSNPVSRRAYNRRLAIANGQSRPADRACGWFLLARVNARSTWCCESTRGRASYFSVTMRLRQPFREGSSRTLSTSNPRVAGSNPARRIRPFVRNVHRPLLTADSLRHPGSHARRRTP
jgi:hypothetical protein